MSAPYIGARISLVSKSEVRYEGTLYNINTQEATVALHNVQAFGTEGRRKDGPQIPPKSEIFEYVIFKGADIKDLEVCEAAPSAEEFQDPAIVKAVPAESQPEKAPAGAGPGARAGPGAGGETEAGVGVEANGTQPSPQVNERYQGKSRSDQFERQRSYEHRTAANQEHGSYQSSTDTGRGRGRGRGRARGWVNRGRGGGGARPGTGAHLLHIRPRHAVGAAEPPLEGAFDFESMNERFDKASEFAKLSNDAGEDGESSMALGEGDVASSGKPVYDKASSFFDTLSCDITDKSQGRSTRLYGAEERNLNKETFGATGLAYSQRYRGQGRGRGRGQGRGRGRGRGGPRGGRGTRGRGWETGAQQSMDGHQNGSNNGKGSEPLWN